MLGNVADGFLGLFMFMTHWLSPGNNVGEIRVAAVNRLHSRTVFECVISFDWNSRMSDLLDAGIPVRFRVFSYSDRGDSCVSIRTLFCDVGDYTYFFTDSLKTPMFDSVYTSKSFRQVYRAVREYQRITRSVTNGAGICHIEAVLLPSHVSRLNRSVDMSDICGCRKFATRIVIDPAKKERP